VERVAISVLSLATPWPAVWYVPLFLLSSSLTHFSFPFFFFLQSFAPTNNATACANAGSLGGSACVDSNVTISLCTSFCTASFINCSAAYGATSPTDQAAFGLCVGTCYADAFLNKSTAYPYTLGGDNVACRVNHALAAYDSNDIATHCPHAATLGGGACGVANSFNNQARFCYGAAQVCGAAYPYPGGTTECLTDAAGYDTTTLSTQYGPVNSMSGDTL
jgi:hypothetical protein